MHAGETAGSRVRSGRGVRRRHRERAAGLGVEPLEPRRLLAAASPPQILLDAATLSRLRQSATDNTSQWQAFRGRLDAHLDLHIADVIGSYQGEQLTFIADYALGYQVLKAADPLTASKYADKAIALMKSGVRDYQKGSWVAQQFLARGDGTTASFDLPNVDVHPGTLVVSLAAVTTYPVVHGTADGQDDVDYYQNFLQVSRTQAGGSDYRDGLDWRHNAEYANNQIDWSLPGAEPTVGSTYYVTAASGASASRTSAYTLSGNRITFAQAPLASQAVFVQYIYGTPSADGSTIDYQQTSAGDGGFNSIFIDDTYTSRYLGSFLAIGLDWLDGYPGFRAEVAQEISGLLVRWADWLAAANANAFGGYNGYFYRSPLSNYGVGSYNALVMTGLALGPRNAAGPRLLNAAQAYREQFVLPALQSPTDSAKGGYWSEGWNYGHNAAQLLLLAARALETAGRITASAERQWAGEVIDNLASEQPAPGSIYDGGDVYQYPFRILDKSLFYSLADMADSPTRKAFANHYLRNYPDAAFRTPGDTNDFRDLLLRDPNAAAAYWSDQPLQRLASGTGLVTARSDWGGTPTWLSLQMGNLLAADHQNYMPGQLQISRGADKLLSNAFQVDHVYGTDSAGLRSLSQYGNIVAVDDRGAVDQYGYRLQDTPFCMGVDYGTPGVVIGNFEAAADHVYVNGDYHAAYSYADAPGAGGPASGLTRQLVYLRPDVAFVYDRVVTTKPEYDKQVRWNFDVAPAVAGDGFSVTVGGSRLFGRTFSASPLKTVSAQMPVVGNPAYSTHRVTTQNTDTAADVAFLTVFETADATQAAMNAAVRVATSDGRMEGGRIGNQLVLFGRGGDVDLTTPVSYALTGNTVVSHLLTNLAARQNYRIVADGVALGDGVASTQGVLQFTTPAGARTLEVTRATATTPGAPTNVTVAAGSGQASLSWSAPGSTGGSAISDYRIEYSSNAGGTWTTFAHAASAATTAVVTGLTNGTSYIFRISAVNAAGTGAASAHSAAVTPAAFTPTSGVTIGTVEFGTTPQGYAFRQSGVVREVTFNGRNTSAGYPGGGWTMRGAWGSGTGYQVFWRGPNGAFATWTLNASGGFAAAQSLTAAQVRQLETQLSFDLDQSGTVG